MNLGNAYGAKTPRKKRFPVGKGSSSGLGKTCGKGQKGQKSRSGVSYRLYFEGGQMPMVRRLPKRGFNNKVFKTVYETVNVSQLEKAFAAGDQVDEAALRAKGLVRKKCDGVKILGDGALTKALVVRAGRFTKSAEEKIRSAGGTVELTGEAEAAPEPAEKK